MPVKYRSLKEQNGVGPKTNGTVNGTERDRQKTNGTVKERNGKDQKTKTAAGYLDVNPGSYVSGGKKTDNCYFYHIYLTKQLARASRNDEVAHLLGMMTTVPKVYLV